MGNSHVQLEGEGDLANLERISTVLIACTTPENDHQSEGGDYPHEDDTDDTDDNSQKGDAATTTTALSSSASDDEDGVVSPHALSEDTSSVDEGTPFASVFFKEASSEASDSETSTTSGCSSPSKAESGDAT